MFAGLLERVNSLENLVTLDTSIHPMFNSGALTLTPETATWDPIPVINDYTGGYWLDIAYEGLCYTEYIQSTKGLSTGEVRILYPLSRITIACHEAMRGHASILPLPSCFALRAFVLSLKNIITEEPLPYDALAPPSASLTPVLSPLSNIGISIRYTHPPPTVPVLIRYWQRVPSFKLWLMKELWSGHHKGVEWPIRHAVKWFGCCPDMCGCDDLMVCI